MEGGCYCGAIRYKTEGEPLMKGECFCRECQYATGGNSLFVMIVPTEGFEITKGTVKDFSHPGKEGAVTRQFCPECGTQLFTRAPSLPHGVIVKVGTLDDPAAFGGPAMAIQADDAQPFHRLPDHIPVFQKWMS